MYFGTDFFFSIRLTLTLRRYVSLSEYILILYISVAPIGIITPLLRAGSSNEQSDQADQAAKRLEQTDATVS